MYRRRYLASLSSTIGVVAGCSSIHVGAPRSPGDVTKRYFQAALSGTRTDAAQYLHPMGTADARPVRGTDPQVLSARLERVETVHIADGRAIVAVDVRIDSDSRINPFTVVNTYRVHLRTTEDNWRVHAYAGGPREPIMAFVAAINTDDMAALEAVMHTGSPAAEREFAREHVEYLTMEIDSTDVWYRSSERARVETDIALGSSDDPYPFTFDVRRRDGEWAIWAWRA